MKNEKGSKRLDNQQLETCQGMSTFFCGVVTLLLGSAILYSGMHLSLFQSLPLRLFVGTGTVVLSLTRLSPWFVLTFTSARDEVRKFLKRREEKS